MYIEKPQHHVLMNPVCIGFIKLSIGSRQLGQEQCGVCIPIIMRVERRTTVFASIAALLSSTPAQTACICCLKSIVSQESQDGQSTHIISSELPEQIACWQAPRGQPVSSLCMHDTRYGHLDWLIVEAVLPCAPITSALGSFERQICHRS